MACKLFKFKSTFLDCDSV